jgi:hypothetical protein
MAAGATYEYIQTTTLNSNVNSVTLSSITNTYTDLILIGYVQQDASYDTPTIRFNGDTGANYSTLIFSGSTSTIASLRGSNDSFIYGGYYAVPPVPDNFGTMILHINNYSNTNIKKTLIIKSGRDTGGIDLHQGYWNSTNAINSITINMSQGTNWAAGTTFNLYGIKAA